jgi:hypothetical protein
MRTQSALQPLLRTVLVAVPLALTTACETGDDGTAEQIQPIDAQAQVAPSDAQRFTADLSPLNAHLLDSAPAGVVSLETRGDSLIIVVTARGLPPGMMHLQHFHGFEDGSPARCPGPDADANGDGVIDVIETATMAGTTMVPFHADPASMEIDTHTYPRADTQGAYSFRTAVSLDSLRSAFRAKFGGDLALDRRVVFIHGVPPDVQLPGSAETKAGLPVHVSLPIACGELRPQ